MAAEAVHPVALEATRCCCVMPRGVRGGRLSADKYGAEQYHGDDGPERRAARLKMSFARCSARRASLVLDVSPWSTANETSDALGAHVAAAVGPGSVDRAQLARRHHQLRPPGPQLRRPRANARAVWLRGRETCRPLSRRLRVATGYACGGVWRGTHHAAGLTPFEVGCFLSHKRALAALARSRFHWGAVFEEDATLHASVLPSHAALLIQRAIAAAASEAVLYLGACSPRCAATTTTAHGLPPWLLSGARCMAYCTHAYALSARHAASFFESVFCHGGPCGRDCARAALTTMPSCAGDREHRRRGRRARARGSSATARESARWVGDHARLARHQSANEMLAAVERTAARRRSRAAPPLARPFVLARARHATQRV